MEAKKSKNSAICALRTEDPQSKEAGFNEPSGGYMKVEFEAVGLGYASRPEREKGWWAVKSAAGSATPDLALERRGIVFLASGCRRELSISGQLASQ
jgi:hypothetical protein